MKRHYFFFLFLVLLVPFSYAFDCNIFQGSDKDSCISLNGVDENLIANLIYKNTSQADHEFIKNYNQQITVQTPPEETTLVSKGIIKDAWLTILTIQPSIILDSKFFVHPPTTTRSDYGYHVEIPPDYINNQKQQGQICKIHYSFVSQSDNLQNYANNQLKGTGRTVTFNVAEDANLSARLNIQATHNEDTFTWQKYCCQKHFNQCVKYCLKCSLSQKKQENDVLNLESTKFAYLWTHQPNASFTLTRQYAETTQGTLTRDPKTSVSLTFAQSSHQTHIFAYSANFSHKPYYFLNLQAQAQETQTIRNLYKNNDTIYVHDPTNCSLTASDPFTTLSKDCTRNISETPIQPIEKTNYTKNWNLILILTIIVLLGVFAYRFFRKYGQKYLLVFLPLLFIPSVSAAEECGLTNLAVCIPQKIYEFFLSLLNAPLQPLLDLIKSLLQTAPNIDLFLNIWAIIVYCLSMFFGLLFLYAGFLFLFSGHDVIRREMAKEWLKNIVIMVALIQGSFYLYGLLAELGSVMSTSVLSLVDPHFFMLTADNILNVGLEFLFTFLYVIILFVTVICLTIRYITVAIGVIFFPVGIFCYFIPPLRSYGKLIINTLLVNIFITFLAAIIILACSKLTEVNIFANMKILVMIVCFLIVDILFIILSKHIAHKTGADDGAEKLGQAAKYIAMMV